jgi:hypothetical protein
VISLRRWIVFWVFECYAWARIPESLLGRKGV